MNKIQIRAERYIEKMPSLPVTVTKILEICGNPRTSPSDLNKVISLDPVLMGKVMKLINSAYYGLPNQITSLVRAIIMLGINTVKNLALSTAVLGSLKTEGIAHGLNMEGFWRHSLCVGVVSKKIEKQRHPESKTLEEYFVTGLLHDIGKIPLNAVATEIYIQTLLHSDLDHISHYKAEKELLFLDHTDIGHSIIERWGLSNNIKESIDFHHHPEEYEGKNKDLVYTVALANYFANITEIGFSGDRHPEKISPKVIEYLNITWDFLDEIEEDVKEEIKKAQIFLKIS